MRSASPGSLVVLLLMCLPGCAEETAPEAGADAGLAEVEDRTSGGSDGEFWGVYSQVVTVRGPTGTQTNYGREGDDAIRVDDNATSMLVVAEVSGSTPGEWELCVTQGDPHDGVCAVGLPRIEVLVEGEALANGDWHPWVFLAEGAVPAGAAAAMEISWQATVTYA